MLFKEMVKFIDALYKAYIGSDASMFEINPVLKHLIIKF
jgi:succinyl-CoA synthetase beta subunit